MGRSKRFEVSRIAQALVRRRGLIRPKDLFAAGVSRSWIPFLRWDKDVVLQPPGVLAAPGCLYPREICAAVKWPRFVIAGPSALGIRGRWRPLAVPWLALDGNTHRPRTTLQVEFLSYQELRADPDVETVDYERVTVRAFSVERALADCLRHLERISVADLAPALRTALNDGVATLAGIEARAREKHRWADVRAALAVLLEGPLPATEPWVHVEPLSTPLTVSPWGWYAARPLKRDGTVRAWH